MITVIDDLFAATGDPFVRTDVPWPPGSVAYGCGSAVVCWRQPALPSRPARPCLFGGTSAEAAELLAWLVDTQPYGRNDGITIERQHASLLAAHFEVGDGGDWDWWSCTSEPALQPSEGLVEELDDRRDTVELAELNARAYPGAESEPGSGRMSQWLGIRQQGRLVAAVALDRHLTGGGIVTGIVVAPEARGRGFGRAVLGRLTREVVRSDGLVALGMNVPNVAAAGLYQSLGYGVGHRFASRALQPLSSCIVGDSHRSTR